MSPAPKSSISRASLASKPNDLDSFPQTTTSRLTQTLHDVFIGQGGYSQVGIPYMLIVGHIAGVEEHEAANQTTLERYSERIRQDIFTRR